MNTAKKILRMPDVLEQTGLCRTTIWRMVKAGTFPKPVELGSRARGWRSSEVDEWIDGRPVAGEAAGAEGIAPVAKEAEEAAGETGEAAAEDAAKEAAG